MNERKRIDVLKKNAQRHERTGRCTITVAYVKRIVTEFNNTPHVGTMRLSVPEKWKADVHVRTCRYTPFTAFIFDIWALPSAKNAWKTEV